MAARRPTPRFAPLRRRGDRRSGAPPSKKVAKTGKTDSSACGLRMTERNGSAPFCSPLQSGGAGQLPRQGGAMIVRRVIALHTKKHQAPLLMSFRAIVKNPHPSSLAPSLRELSPKVTEGVFPSRTRMGRRILRPYGLRMTERKRIAPFCSPLQSGGAGQLPRQGGAMIVRRVIALHTKKHQAPLLMSFRAIVKNPHPSSLAPSLRELSPKVTEGVFPSRTRMGRRILRPAASE